MKYSGILILLSLYLIASCEREKTVIETETVYDTIYQHDTIFNYDTITDTDTLIDTVIVIPESAEVSYEQHIQPIWDNNCIACHNQYASFNLEASFSYEEIVPDKIDDETPDNSQIYTITQSGQMPPSGELTKTELAYILEWIKRGTPNN